MGAPVLGAVVDADGLEVLGQQVAQQLGDQALLAVEHGGRPLRLRAAPDLAPHLEEEAQVADDVGLGPAGCGGADDDAAGEAVLLAERRTMPRRRARSSRASILRDTPM